MIYHTPLGKYTMYIPKRLTMGITKTLRSPLFEVVDFAKFREIADEVRNFWEICSHFPDVWDALKGWASTEEI